MMQYAEQVWGLISSTEMEHAEPLDLERAIPGYPHPRHPPAPAAPQKWIRHDKNGLLYVWLVVTIPNIIWTNKTCSKPPTSIYGMLLDVCYCFI
jgi:hypothetical protein